MSASKSLCHARAIQEATATSQRGWSSPCCAQPAAAHTAAMSLANWRNRFGRHEAAARRSDEPMQPLGAEVGLGGSRIARYVGVGVHG